MTLSEKAAYLKGLAEGMNVQNEGQGKLLLEVIDMLGSIAKSVSDLEDETDRLGSYAEELDEDLGSLEEFVYEDDECDCCDCDDCDCDDDYDEDDDFDPDEDDEDEDDDSVIEVECPNCGETICLPPTIDLAHLICPACNTEFSCIVDVEEDEDGETGGENE